VDPPGAQGGAAWLPDPEGRYDARYWDGNAWTTAVIRDGRVDTDAGPVATPGQQPRSALPSYQDFSPLNRWTSLPPSEAMSRTGQLMVVSGWSVTTTAANRLHGTVSVRREPSLLSGLLVYVIVKLRPRTCQADISVAVEGDGARVSATCDPPAVERLTAVLSQLPW
jgi:hypothetical protein